MSSNIWQPDGVTEALGAKEIIVLACSSLTINLAAGTSIGYHRVPVNSGFTLSGIEASLLPGYPSTSGSVTVDVNKNGVTILSTKLTIDVNELTSTTAAVPCVITDTDFAEGDVITVDCDNAGANARGLAVTFRGNYVSSLLG